MTRAAATAEIIDTFEQRADCYRPTLLDETPHSPNSSLRVHLKCPACSAQIVLYRRWPYDHCVACASCGAKSEFRQMHEAWCIDARRTLMRTYPELAASNSSPERREGI